MADADDICGSLTIFIHSYTFRSPKQSDYLKKKNEWGNCLLVYDKKFIYRSPERADLLRNKFSMYCHLVKTEQRTGWKAGSHVPAGLKRMNVCETLATSRSVLQISGSIQTQVFLVLLQPLTLKSYKSYLKKNKKETSTNPVQNIYRCEQVFVSCPLSDLTVV